MFLAPVVGGGGCRGYGRLMFNIRFELVDGADVAQARAIMATMGAREVIPGRQWVTTPAAEDRAGAVAEMERQLDERAPGWRDFVGVS